MASRAICPLEFTNEENVECWIMAFEAAMKAKNIQDDDGDLKITNNFLSVCGLEALKKLRASVSPRQLPDLKFTEIKTHILSLLQPKDRLIVAERIQFLSLQQVPEESEVNYLTKLKAAAKFCQFNDFKKCTDPEMELIKMKFWRDYEILM